MRVLLIDDNPLFRNTVAERLARELGVEVVGQAGSGHAGLKLAAELWPDVVIVDLAMPDISGLEVAERLK